RRRSQGHARRWSDEGPCPHVAGSGRVFVRRLQGPLGPSRQVGRERRLGIRMKKHFIIAIIAVAAAVTAILAQTNDSLANLIQQGKSKAALDKIKAGANVNEAQADGTRPVHWAVFKVDYELLQALIAKKADVNTPNEFGSTPLAEAIKLSDPKMVK